VTGIIAPDGTLVATDYGTVGVVAPISNSDLATRLLAARAPEQPAASS
jgi:hypothetical protein